VLYSSMEPCLMCFSVCCWAKITKIVYAISKQKLAPEHYEGLHDIKTINQGNSKQMEIVHVPELENEALEVVHNWEKLITK